ncbi:terminase [Chryseobacterium sp. G0240]|uniref:terminase n=1 Tax=Chryseobacterium sp. G0240 TaxID=2487066 RepID=UPI001E360C8E|nr:terminase [Chryseobacterium sp. G0240]
MMAGAPTKYNPEYNDQVYKICLLGATDKDLADFFNVAESTINNWKKEYPEFLESIKRGKQIADANVADRLYQRALGFEHDSEEIKVIEGDIERVPVRKVYPPDPTSAIFWLKNRQPEKWRDKQEIENNGNLTINWNEEKTYE